MKDTNDLRVRYVNGLYIDFDRRKIDELIDEIGKLKESVPLSFRDSIRVSFEGDYDSSSVSISMTYQSPVTEADRAAEKRRQEYREQAERFHYEALKKKFGE